MKWKGKVSLVLLMSIISTSQIPRNLQASEYTGHVPTDATYVEAQIAKVFNKFRYDMTVEWDQIDPYFKAHAEKELEISLMSLEAEGVTEEHFLSYLENNLIDKNALKVYRELLLALHQTGASPEHASLEAQKFMENTFAHGTNFSGFSGRSYHRERIAVGVIIVGVVTLNIFKHHLKKPENRTDDQEDISGLDDGSANCSEEILFDRNDETFSCEGR